MRLPRGITGFWESGEDPPPATDLRAFRGHCHAAAHCVGGRVHSVMEPNPGGVCRNFAVGVLVLTYDAVAVVLNAHYPILAFADPPAEGDVLLQFTDCPELADVFSAFDVYQVVSASEWEQPPTPTALRDLSPAERGQVAYWKPRRIGDVVFNCWD